MCLVRIAEERLVPNGRLFIYARRNLACSLSIEPGSWMMENDKPFFKNHHKRCPHRSTALCLKSHFSSAFTSQRALGSRPWPSGRAWQWGYEWTTTFAQPWADARRDLHKSSFICTQTHFPILMVVGGCRSDSVTVNQQQEDDGINLSCAASVVDSGDNPEMASFHLTF